MFLLKNAENCQVTGLGKVSEGWKVGEKVSGEIFVKLLDV